MKTFVDEENSSFPKYRFFLGIVGLLDGEKKLIYSLGVH